MCGRFTLSSPAEIVAEVFELPDTPAIEPRYNIAPTQPVPVVRVDASTGRRRFDSLHWGLIPGWARDPSIGNRMINARSETAAEKPSFRSALRRRRCLVVADGFYEWQKLERAKQPWCIRSVDGGPFGFAGLWEHWHGSDGTEIESCTILTTSPNGTMQPLHDRMPVILDPEDFAVWLDPGVEATNSLTALLRPCPDERLTAFRVSTHVNRPGNDDPTCLAPIDTHDR